MAEDESTEGVNSSFGLPITGRGPKSMMKRVTAKFIWPFLRHQVDVNLVLVSEIRDLQTRHDALLTLVEQQLSDSGHVNSSIRRLDTQVDFVEDGLHNIEKALQPSSKKSSTRNTTPPGIALSAETSDHT